MKARARHYRNAPCCGGAPEWNDPFTPRYENGYNWGGLYTPYGGPLSQAETEAIEAIESYGGTAHPGIPSVMRSLTRYDYQNNSGRTEMTTAQPAYWGAPYNPNVPRISSAQELPSLPTPPNEDPYLTHVTETSEYLKRERVRATPTPAIRALWNGTHHIAQIQWCDSCGPDEWESFAEGMSTLASEALPVVRAITMVCSYIPVLGTAVSFVINATIDLAEGQEVSSALLSAMGHALPGQPVSGVAFDVVRGVINGETVTEIGTDVVLDQIPGINDDAKKAIRQAVVIVEAIASGEPVTKVIVDQIYQAMPPLGQKAMDIGRKVLDGENIPGLIVGEATEAAANAANAGGDAVKQRFIAEAGYHGAINALADELRMAVQAAIVAGRIEREMPAHQAEILAQGGFDTKERNTTTLDGLAAHGRTIMSSPKATYNGVQLQTLHDRTSLTMTMPQYDALTLRALSAAPQTFTVTYGFRRGFEVGIATYEGIRKEDAEKQDPTKTTSPSYHELELNETDAKAGFRVAREMQFERTRTQNVMGRLIASPISAKQTGAVQNLLATLAPVSTQDKSIHAVAQFQQGYVKPVNQQKQEDLAKWVNYYADLG